MRLWRFVNNNNNNNNKKTLKVCSCFHVTSYLMRQYKIYCPQKTELAIAMIRVTLGRVLKIAIVFSSQTWQVLFGRSGQVKSTSNSCLIETLNIEYWYTYISHIHITKVCRNCHSNPKFLSNFYTPSWLL